MNTLILSVLIQTYCQNWIASEYMRPQTYEEGAEYYNCVNDVTEEEIFEIDNLKTDDDGFLHSVL